MPTPAPHQYLPSPDGKPKESKCIGRHHAVPCPWCKFPNDFRALAGDADQGGGWGDTGFEKGAKLQCDNPQCKRFFVILAIEKPIVLQIAPCRPPQKG